MDFDDTLDRLGKLSSLEEISLCIIGPYHTFDKHERHNLNKYYKTKVLNALIVPNSKLKILDGVSEDKCCNNSLLVYLLFNSYSLKYF